MKNCKRRYIRECLLLLSSEFLYFCLLRIMWRLKMFTFDLFYMGVELFSHILRQRLMVFGNGAENVWI